MGKVTYSLKNNKILNFNIVATVLVSIAIMLYLNFYTQDLNSIARISIFVYLIFFTSWFMQCKEKINYYSIFLLFTFFFYFGQFFLMLIGIPLDTSRTIVSGILPYEGLIKTGIFIINYMIILHIGVLFSTLNISFYDNIDMSYKEDDYLFTIISEKQFKKVALFLFFISIIPTCIMLYKNIKITFNYGYGKIFESEYYTTGGFNNILRFISLFTVPSFLMLIIGYKNDKKIKLIRLVLLIYLLLYFLSGSRLGGVLLLSSLLLVENYWYKRISRRTMLRMIIIGIIGLIVLSLISAVRNSIYIANDINSLLSETIKQIVEKNPLFSVMEEAGFTFLATAVVIIYCPSIVPYNKGMSYLNSLFMLFPNLFWDVHPAAEINTDITFKGFLTRHGGIGSSFIAESYWNFGRFSFFIAFIFGLFIGSLTKKTIKYSKQRNMSKFYLCIYISQISLFYVRSDTISFWRNFVYYGVMPILLVKILSKNKYLKGKSNIKERSKNIRFRY